MNFTPDSNVLSLLIVLVCVPAFVPVPFLPNDMSTFNEAVGLSSDFKFESLEYENACDTSTVQSLISPLVGELSTIGFIKAPYGSLLRIAEGIDSIRNFAGADAVNSTESQRASAVVCGMAQLGGVIWMSIVVIFLGAACICAPIGSWCCLSCYRGCVRRGRRDGKREAAIDRLLARQDDTTLYLNPMPLVQQAAMVPKVAPKVARPAGKPLSEAQRLLGPDAGDV